MATADQIKSLIKSHYDQDREKFTTIALQLAAAEARKGHGSLAHDIKSIIDKGNKSPLRVISTANRNLSDLIQASDPQYRLSQLIVHNELKSRIERILKEYIQRSRLQKHGLSHRRKILLAGPSGTGKTLTASVIAKEINVPLYVILMDKFITKYMGETSAKLRQIFDFINENIGVYLFDEFDAIGTERSRDNDVGEMRRVLNSFLQFLELDTSNSFVIAATNNVSLLDHALFRRFDDVLFYQLPEKEEIFKLIENKLAGFNYDFSIKNIPLKEVEGLSHAEISQACDDAIKETILSDNKKITKTTIGKMLQHRREIYMKK
jgi:SpoVK/Ycf46/Vps4 family AAA+-type ATPase